MKGRIVGDTQCKAIQFVLLAVVVKVGKMDTDLLLTRNGYMLGGDVYKRQGLGAALFLGAATFFGESWIVILFPSKTGIWSTFA